MKEEDINEVFYWKLQEIIENFKYGIRSLGYSPNFKLDFYSLKILREEKKKLDDWFLALTRYQEGELAEAEKILKNIEF